MTTKTLDQWSRSLLPGNFDQLRRQTQAIQQFLSENLPEAVQNQVSVINLSEDEIVLAATSPQIANYLRLYVAELQQQLLEALRMRQKLKIRSAPESLQSIVHPPKPGKPLKVSQDTVQSISQSVDWIEDDNLKQSLASLAKTLEAKNRP